MEQNNTKEEVKNPKIVATAYLPTGKELRFVYDKVLNGTQGCSYLIEGEVVAFIPFSIPIMFETYTEQLSYENMQRKIRETPMRESKERKLIGVIEVEYTMLDNPNPYITYLTWTDIVSPFFVAPETEDLDMDVIKESILKKLGWGTKEAITIISTWYNGVHKTY